MPEPTFEEIDALARQIYGRDGWSAIDEVARNFYRIVAVGRLNKPPADPTRSTLEASPQPRPPPAPTSQDP